MSEAAFSTASASFELPRKLGRRVLLKLIARGGMGDVYLAASTGLEGAERASVVKTIRRDHIHDGSFLARFLDEARVQSQLNHPGVAQVLEAATDENGEPYTVVEYIEGRSLADVQKRAAQLGMRVGWAEACAIAIEMGQALSHVHERSGADGTPLGIVHRDLSPQNVMIGYAGEVKLIDFGTARGHNRKCHTVAGVVFAKPGYVAPEIARHEVGDGRIDIYAMGVILWELCKNQRLLTTDPQKHLEDVARGKFITTPVAASINAPIELDDVVTKLLANDPEQRYVSASAASADLAKLLGKAPAAKGGERSVRARVGSLMLQLFPAEPSRSRAEFAKMLREAKDRVEESLTPPVSSVMEIGERQVAADPSLLPGTPYKLLRKIGEGASGSVWEAEHTELARKVALKILEQAHSSAIDSIDRFRREARAVANLSHPNVAFLHDFGKSLDGRVYLAMELLEGETLGERIARTEAGGVPMSWQEAVEIAMDTARALEAVHGAGLVHRDLKPENLYITREGTLKLLDFGVALAKSDTGLDEKRQRGFAVFGTPEYMAPEQVSGEVVDGRCDVYALGCVLFELLTGRRAFEGESAVVVMGMHLRERPPSVRATAPGRGIPKELDELVLRALAKSPDARFESAVALREALLQVALLPMKQRSARRQKFAAFTAVALAALCGVGVGNRAGIASILHGSKDSTLARESVAPAAIVPTETLPPVVAIASLPVASTEIEAQAPHVYVPEKAVESTHSPAEGDAKVHAVAAPAEIAGLPALPHSPRAPQAEHIHRASVEAGSGEEHVGLELAHARKPSEAPPALVDVKELRARARAALGSKRYDEARLLAEQWSMHDGSSEPRIILARALDGMGNRDEARNVMTVYLKRHPASEDAKKAAKKLSIDPSLAPRPHLH